MDDYPHGEITVMIRNDYECGHVRVRDVVVDGPAGDLDEWWQDVVYPETGDPHGHGDEGSIHEARVIGCPTRPIMAGLTYEWD